MVKTLPTVAALMRDHPALLGHCPFACIVTACAVRPGVTAGTARSKRLDRRSAHFV